MVHQDADLIGQLGKKTSEGNNTPQPDSTVEPAKTVETPKTAATETTASAGDDSKPKEAEASKEVADPNTWSKESALKEVQKLREENKAQRLKYGESLEKIKGDLEEKNVPLKEQLQELSKYKEKLERLEAEEADKKRGLEEKVSHRDALLGDLEAKYNSLQASKDSEAEALKSRLYEFEARDEARKQVYKERLEKELESIPSKYREQADLIVKGAGDPSEGLVAINEAKLMGLFEDKTVSVVHQVPTASQGARASQDSLDNAAKAERDSMTGDQKVKQALKDIRSGSSNSAFRTK